MGEECLEAGPLDVKTRELVKLGISFGAGLEGAAHSHVRRALEQGATPDELRHAALLALTTMGFPRMMSSLLWVEDILSRK
ncbi:MAG: carboxymuconolactone decarboxylase family protein [Thermoplasmata archaeon]